MVTVGHPKNPGDPDAELAGAVGYEFKIGAYEVTNAEYAAFLNAVASSEDLYNLYDDRMASVQGGIKREQNERGFSYAVVNDCGEKPVNYVDLASAMRYCNWLHNGALVMSDTENGAYRMSNAVKRNPSARYFLPNENEWYKAAYFDPTANRTRNYWSYAMRTDRPKRSQIAGLRAVAGLQNVGVPRFRSFFGTYGQTGNVAEWVETFNESRGMLMGGGLGSDWSDPINAQRREEDNSLRSLGVGFRIAAKVSSESMGSKRQVLSFRRLPVLRLGSAGIRLRATSNSLLPLRFASSDTNVVEVVETADGPRLFARAPGKAIITVSQDGDSVWAPARSVSRPILVRGAKR